MAGEKLAASIYPEVAERLMMEHLEPTVSYLDPEEIGIERVWLKDSGIHIWALAEAYHQLDDKKDKVDVLAQKFHINRPAAEAGILYYERYQEIFDARLFLNTIDPDDQAALEIIQSSKRMDNIFEPH